MKKIILVGLSFFAHALLPAQTVTQAIISTSTNVIAPDAEEVQNIQNQGAGGGGQFFRNFGDGETVSTTYIKNDLTKTVLKSDMGRSTIIRDNGKKMTTTLLEIMGNKTGFYMSDEEQAAMKVRMDSMMQARRNSDSTRTRQPNNTNTTAEELIYTNERKKIAGYDCKKVYIVNTRLLGIKDSVAVWYTPELKISNMTTTGGTSSFGNFGNFGNFTSLNGLDKIDGFVMYYEMNMRRGRRMIVEVKKIDLKKEITDKEFEIPKDFDVKPMKEFQSMMQQGAGMQFRTGS